VEAGVLFCGQVAEPDPAVAGEERGDVDEVVGLGSTEQSEHLVCGELVERQHGAVLRRFGDAERAS